MPTSDFQRQRAMLKATVSVPDHVVHRAFVSETVLLNLQTGRYHGLNPTAGRMLELLENHGRIDRAAAQLAEEFRIPIVKVEQDLVHFCEDLASRDLIEITPPPGG